MCARVCVFVCVRFFGEWVWVCFVLVRACRFSLILVYTEAIHMCVCVHVFVCVQFSKIPFYTKACVYVNLCVCVSVCCCVGARTKFFHDSLLQ